MNYPNNSPQDFDDAFGTQLPAIIPHKPSLLGVFLGRSTDVLTEDIRADAELATFRMQLTEFSLTRLGMLSAMEQQLSSMTPQAAERYQALVDTCVRQTIKQIERW